MLVFISEEFGENLASPSRQFSPQVQIADSSSTNAVSFHPHAQRNAFRRRDVRLQSRLFASENVWLRPWEIIADKSQEARLEFGLRLSD
jgi:hypothetical protein